MHNDAVSSNTPVLVVHRLLFGRILGIGFMNEVRKGTASGLPIMYNIVRLGLPYVLATVGVQVVIVIVVAGCAESAGMQAVAIGCRTVSHTRAHVGTSTIQSILNQSTSRQMMCD